MTRNVLAKQASFKGRARAIAFLQLVGLQQNFNLPYMSHMIPVKRTEAMAALRLKVFFAVYIISTPAMAWGPEGHAIIANVAEKRLTPAALSAVGKLMHSEGVKHLRDISIWADEIRVLKIPRQPAHVAQLPLEDIPYDKRSDCPKDCLINAITADLKVLKNPKAPTAAKSVALNYIVHFVGDLHQPLHATSGGHAFMTIVEGKKRSLHYLWDHYIIEQQSKSVAELTADVENGDANRIDNLAGPPYVWATETRDFARNSVITGEFASKPAPPRPLSTNYAERTWPFAKQQLLAAGVRLAYTLNVALDPSYLRR